MILAFPAVLTAYEFLFSLISPNGTLWSVGYSQTDFLPVLQVVALTGLWGVVFILGLVPSAAALAWHRRSATLLVPALIIVVPVLGYGSWRLRSTVEASGVRVGLAATDRGLPDASITADTSVALAAATTYAERIARLGAQGAEVVVLPEKMIGVTLESADPVINVLGDAARVARVTVIVGLSRNAVQPRHNVAVVFSPDGTRIAEYEKHHPVPIIERDFARGGTPVLFTGPGAQWGLAICKDLDFPAWSREYGRRGVRFLAVPAWDFVFHDTDHRSRHCSKVARARLSDISPRRYGTLERLGATTALIMLLLIGTFRCQSHGIRRVRGELADAPVVK